MSKTVKKNTTAKPKEKLYGWCFNKKGNAVEVERPMTAAEIKKLKA